MSDPTLAKYTSPAASTSFKSALLPQKFQSLHRCFNECRNLPLCFNMQSSNGAGQT